MAEGAQFAGGGARLRFLPVRGSFVRRHSGAAPTVVESGTFLLLRFIDPEALVEPASPDVTQRLAELDNELSASGWHRREMLGRYWWSWMYEKGR